MRLESGELNIFLHAWWLFLSWDFRIRFLSYQKWKASVFVNKTDDEQNASITLSQSQQTMIRKLVHISEKAGRNHLTKMNCLRRCLVQKQLLKSHGFDSELNIGIALSKGKLKAHAWLSINQQPINDSIEVIGEYKKLTTITDQSLSALL